MANQATTTNDDLEQISRANEPILKKIKQQEEKALGKEQNADLIGGTKRDILTGKSKVIDFLKYKEAKKEKERVDKELSGREQELLKNDWLKEKERLAEEVFSASGIENQEEIVKQTFYDEPSPGRVDWAFNRAGILIGLPKMHPKRSEAILKENEKINSRFKGKIPYNELPVKVLAKVLALDDVAVELKDEKAKKLLSRARGRGVFGETKVSLYRFIYGQKRIKSTDKVTQRIGVDRAQSVDKSVDYSIRELLKANNLGDAMERIYAGTTRRGSIISLPNGVSNGLANLSATGGSFLKKSLVNLGGKLGPGIKKGVGSSFNNIAGGFGKASFGAVELLSSVGGFGLKIKATVVVGGIFVILGIIFGFTYLQQIIPSDNTSAWMWDEDAVIIDRGGASQQYRDGGGGVGREY